MQLEQKSKNIRVYRGISIIITVIYIVFWSFVTIKKFYAMNTGIWDLGYLENHIHLIIYDTWSIRNILTQLSNQGILFLMTPFAFTNSIPALLIFQSISLGIPAYLLFEIGFHHTRNPVLSLMICISYLIYFPLAGANISDFQLMDLFIILFLLGYLLLLKEHFSSGFFFLLLSGFVRFPLMVLVSISSLSLSFRPLNLLIRSKNYTIKRLEFTVLVLFVISTAVLLMQYFWLISVNPAAIVTHSSSDHNPLLSVYSKLYVVVLIFGPLLFIPLLSRKWVFPSLVFFVLVFALNNSIYEFPQVFSNWYTVTIIPFLFLGLIDFFSEPDKETYDLRKAAHRHIFREGIKSSSSVKKSLSIIIVLLLSSLAVFMQPYGPLNNNSFNNFHLYNEIKDNSTVFNAATSVISLIPADEAYILVQNDFVQLFPRISIKTLLVPPYFVGPNISSSNLINNAYPYNGGPVTQYLPINYSLSNFNDIHTLTEPSYTKGNPTMLQFDQMLYNSTEYGIVAEDNGIVLLERGVQGTMTLYHPFFTKVNLNNMIYPKTLTKNGEVYVNQTLSNTTLRTPFLCLFPGNFIIKVKLLVNSVTNFNVEIDDGYYLSTTHFNFLNKSNWIIHGSTTEQNCTLNISMEVPKFLGNAQCFIIPKNLSGTMIIKSITITQIA